MRLWDLDTGSLVDDLEGMRRRVHAVAFSPAGSTIAAAGEDDHVVIWDSQTGRKKTTLRRDQGKAMALAYCGSARLAVGRSDNTIAVWNLTTKDRDAVLRGHTGSVVCLMWMADTETLVSGSFDTTVRFWQLDKPNAARAAAVTSDPKSY